MSLRSKDLKPIGFKRCIIHRGEFGSGYIKEDRKFDELNASIFEGEELELLRKHIIHNLTLHKSHINLFDVRQIYNILENGWYMYYPKGKFPVELYALADDEEKSYLFNTILNKLEKASRYRLLWAVAYIQSYYIFS